MPAKRFHIFHFESLDNNGQSLRISLLINKVFGCAKKVSSYSQETCGYSFISLRREYALPGNTLEFAYNKIH